MRKLTDQQMFRDKWQEQMHQKNKEKLRDKKRQKGQLNQHVLLDRLNHERQRSKDATEKLRSLLNAEELAQEQGDKIQRKTTQKLFEQHHAQHSQPLIQEEPSASRMTHAWNLKHAQAQPAVVYADNEKFSKKFSDKGGQKKDNFISQRLRKFEKWQQLGDQSRERMAKDQKSEQKDLAQFWRDQQNQKDQAYRDRKRADKDYLVNVIQATDEANLSIDMVKGELKRKRDMRNRDFLVQQQEAKLNRCKPYMHSGIAEGDNPLLKKNFLRNINFDDN